MRPDCPDLRVNWVNDGLSLTERSVLKKLLAELDLEVVLIQAEALQNQQPFFDRSRSREPTSS